MASPSVTRRNRHLAVEVMLGGLTRFYTSHDAKGRPHIERFLPYVIGPAPVSLRVIDWFVTNYAKEHGTVIELPLSPTASRDKASRDKAPRVRHIDVYGHYRAELKTYSKHLFDPFRRRDRVRLTYNRAGDDVETTVGQLNFFRWMLSNGVLDYVVEHAEAIDANMQQAAASGAGRRQATSHRSAAASPSNNKGNNKHTTSATATTTATSTATTTATRGRQGKQHGATATAAATATPTTTSSHLMRYTPGRKTVMFN